MNNFKKWDIVTGWFGTGVVTDISEVDDLVRVRVNDRGIWTNKRDLTLAVTHEEQR